MTCDRSFRAVVLRFSRDGRSFCQGFGVRVWIGLLFGMEMTNKEHK